MNALCSPDDYSRDCCPYCGSYDVERIESPDCLTIRCRQCGRREQFDRDDEIASHSRQNDPYDPESD